MPVLKIDTELRRDPRSQPPADETTRRLYDEYRQAVVKIDSENAMGSGFFIDGNGDLVTDAHVALSGTQLRVTTASGKIYPARITRLDDIDDLAELKIEGPPPAGQEYLHLGSSSSLKPDQNVYALGHPLGLPSLYISPGYARALEPELDVLEGTGGSPSLPDVLKEIPRMSGPERQDWQLNLARPMLAGDVHIEHGNSGGPLLSADGKVVGVSDLGDPNNMSHSYYTPSHFVKKLVNDPDPKFQFTYAHTGESWTNFYRSAWSKHPADAALITGAVAGAAALLARWLPGPTAMAAGIAGAADLVSDVDKFRHATNRMDRLKYGLATAADAAMAGGAAARSIPPAAPYAWAVMGAGAVGRLAADFIPTELTRTGTRRTDGDPRPPFQL